MTHCAFVVTGGNREAAAWGLLEGCRYLVAGKHAPDFVERVADGHARYYTPSDSIERSGREVYAIPKTDVHPPLLKTVKRLFRRHPEKFVKCGVLNEPPVDWQAAAKQETEWSPGEWTCEVNDVDWSNGVDAEFDRVYGELLEAACDGHLAQEAPVASEPSFACTCLRPDDAAHIERLRVEASVDIARINADALKFSALVSRISEQDALRLIGELI